MVCPYYTKPKYQLDNAGIEYRELYYLVDYTKEELEELLGYKVYEVPILVDENNEQVWLDLEE